MLNLNTRLRQLQAQGRYIRVGIVGAGQMGTGLVAQISRMQGMRVVAVADLTAERAAAAFTKAGVPAGQICTIDLPAAAVGADAAVSAGYAVALAQAEWLTAMKSIDVVVEATGVPEIGARVAELAIAGRKHIVMLNAETDATVGFILRDRAAAARVIYTGAAGDEPACIKELYDFADALGFQVLVAGKGKNNPLRVDATPDQLAAEAAQKGASAKMLTAFVDGTKTMVEMTQLANAIGFAPDCTGMHGPTASVQQLPDLLRPQSEGGILSRYGVVEYVNGIAPGVFIIVTSDQPVVLDTMRYLKMGTGPNYVLYRPYHLTSLETPLSIARAALYGEPSIVAGTQHMADTVAVAKRDLAPGDTLDELGGYTLYGTIIGAHEGHRRRALPLGCAVRGTKVIRPVAKGSIITYGDVELPNGMTIIRLRQEQDAILYGKDVPLA